MRTAASTRLESFLDRTPSGCWEFTGYRDRNGYGVIADFGLARMAHRIAYQMWVGPIPEGLQIDHLCRNRSCCNPEHLEAVTPDENAARTLPGRRGAHVARRELSKTHCPRNHPYDVENTYTNAAGHRHCRACRRERYAEKRNAA